MNQALSRCRSAQAMNVLFKEKEEAGRWYFSVLDRSNDDQVEAAFCTFLTRTFGTSAAFNGFSDADLEKILVYMKEQDIGAMDYLDLSTKLVIILTAAGVRIVYK
jgi:hypothetical protein